MLPVAKQDPELRYRTNKAGLVERISDLGGQHKMALSRLRV